MTAVDPGANAPQGARHPGDDHVAGIRAALERLKLPPEQRVAKQRTDGEAVALAARTVACASREDLERAAARVRQEVAQ